MPLRALFVDFNSFFASVEQQLRPELRGQPVGVVPVMADTTCCIAASYEAKRFGVRTGTLVGEAKRLCPDIVLVEARHEYYVAHHHRLVDAVDSVVPVAEVQSIDEMLCELPRRWQAPEAARAKALEVKQAIAAQVGEYLKCSIGIAPNGFLAKTASDMQKPDGLTVLQASDLPQALYRLELRDLCGIGPRMEKRLLRAGIATIAQLCGASREKLREVWGGIEGELFHDRLRGLEPHTAPTERASIGHSHVLPPELRRDDAARAVLHRMLQKAAMRLRKLGFVAGGMAVAVKYVGGGRWDDEARFNESDDTLELTHVLDALWARRPPEMLKWKPLAVGVTLGRLVPRDQATVSLFEPRRNRAALNAAVDRVNRRYGKNTVYFGAAARALDAAPMRIAFNRIPDPEVER